MRHAFLVDRAVRNKVRPSRRCLISNLMKLPGLWPWILPERAKGNKHGSGLKMH